MTEPTVTNVAASNRYEITVDGVPAGWAAYVDAGNQRVFHHTETDTRFRGRGLAGKLMAAALADTRVAGKRIVPMCSFVAAYVDDHPEYRDVVDPVTAQVQAAVHAQRD